MIGSDRQDTTAAALDDIARAERRTFEAMVYAISSSILILWGVLTAAGYIFGHFQPQRAAWGWVTVHISGLTGMIILLSRSLRSAEKDSASKVRRAAGAQIALMAFGVIWIILLGPFTPRQLNAFWPTLFMLGYVVAGLWVGRFFLYCGIIVTALTLGGYAWSGPWFGLWMAVVNGAALILGGLWLRRIRASL